MDYVVTRGKQKIPLQGILHYPANYEPGKKYPMVVYLYEKLSDGLHRFTNPSERDYYNGTALTQDGYFFFQPDIVFTPREPGVSVVECVTAAVNKVVSMGAVDGAKVGVMGHSWGGFDAMFLATHTKLFAAAVSGAGISDLISNYGNHHWSSGIAETDHIETGQQRMVVPLYEDLQALHPQLRDLRHFDDDDAAVAGGGRLRTARCSGTSRSSCTTSPAARRRTW